MAKFNPKVGKPVELAPGLRRILAPNPSPMTFRGTNTYLLGNRDIAVIDPGPPDEDHLTAIMDALAGHQRISHVFVTHSHIDHSPLAMVLAQMTGTRVYGFGDSKAGRADVMKQLGDIGGGEGVDETFMPDVQIEHGHRVEGSDWTLTAHHTPGHMGNHMCFEWPEGRGLFTGDLIMEWSTSLVSPPDGSVRDFMHSLDRLEARLSYDDVYFPGHGAPITRPGARVVELIKHRRAREAQILDALERGPADAATLAERIYTDIEPVLLPAATRNVLAHLIDLTERNEVTTDGILTADCEFQRA